MSPTLDVVGIVTVVSLAVVFWKMLSVVQSTSSANIRSRDRERKDLLMLVEQSKARNQALTHQGLDVERILAQERIQNRQVDAEVDREEIRQPVPDRTESAVDMFNNSPADEFRATLQ